MTDLKRFVKQLIVRGLFRVRIYYLSYWCDRQWTPLRDRDHSRNDPQWVPGFLSCCSGLFPGTATEHVRTCGLRRNSSSSDKAPRIRDSVRPNSWNSFSVTLLSISSETWAMYTSVIPGVNVFCLAVPCNFLCFSWNSGKLPLISQRCHSSQRGKSSTVVRTELSFFFKWIDSFSNDKITLFFEKEIIWESVTVKKWKATNII